jgi:hypothetical protein
MGFGSSISIFFFQLFGSGGIGWDSVVLITAIKGIDLLQMLQKTEQEGGRG